MNNKAFTLVELIVVLVILGMLIAIAVIAANEWLVRSQVEGQVKALYIDLMNARVYALQKNRAHFVTLGASQYSIYEDTFPSPDGNGSLDLGAGQDRLVLQKALGHPLVAGFPSSVTFATTGLASSNGTIRVEATTQPHSDCIRLFSTRIRMGRWNGTECKAL